MNLNKEVHMLDFHLGKFEAVDKTLAIIESCNTLEQLSVAGRFAKQCVKSFWYQPHFSGHWDAIFHLTIDERAEEIRAELIDDWVHNWE